MEVYVLELYIDYNDYKNHELRGIFTSSEKAVDAVNSMDLKGKWVLRVGIPVYFKEADGKGNWYISRVDADTLFTQWP